jgi:hypothetical protein
MFEISSPLSLSLSLSLYPYKISFFLFNWTRKKKAAEEYLFHFQSE